MLYAETTSPLPHYAQNRNSPLNTPICYNPPQLLLLLLLLLLLFILLLQGTFAGHPTAVFSTRISHGYGRQAGKSTLEQTMKVQTGRRV